MFVSLSASEFPQFHLSPVDLDSCFPNPSPHHTTSSRFAGGRTPATGKEGGEHHVGAVQLQLLPDRGAAGHLHLHLHQDAVPGHPQRSHRIPWFLLESCQDR